MLTERHTQKRHKIDMVYGNIKGNVNFTYTFVVARSTSKFYCKSPEQNKIAKAKKYQRDDISKQLSRAFWKSWAQAPFDFNILFKAVAQHGIKGGLTGAILL